MARRPIINSHSQSNGLISTITKEYRNRLSL